MKAVFTFSRQSLVGLVLFLSTFLASCTFIDETKEAANNVKTQINNTKDDVINASNQVQKAADSIENAAEQSKKALDDVSNAVDSVENIGSDEEQK